MNYNNTGSISTIRTGALVSQAAPQSEIEQELDGYENLIAELKAEIEMVASRLSNVLAVTDNSVKEIDNSVPRNSTIGRRLNGQNCELARLINGLRSIRHDIML